MAKLILVPSPIGNLEDITLRALRVLKEVDVVAAEDTRHSGKLLSHYQIDKPLVRLDAHTIAERAGRILTDYASIAYLSDAGTPGISDPGVELVQMALERGDSVEVLPGATAFVPALVLSALPLGRFSFEGFLPRKGKARQTRLEHIAQSQHTTAFYESPHRLLSTLDDLMAVCGATRQASISRELSKKFETTYRGSLEQLRQDVAAGVKGEIVVVVSANDTVASEVAIDDVALLTELKEEGLTGKALKSAFRKALQAQGMSRNDAYARSLALDNLELDSLELD